MSAEAKEAARPTLRVGLIADIQYSDVPDGQSFAGDEQRYYRKALVETGRAVDTWLGLKDHPVELVLQLGDLIDGQNTGKWGEAKKLYKGESQSELALGRVMEELGRVHPAPVYHLVGNHELYNFSRWELSQLLDNEARGWKISEPKGDGSRDRRFYYASRPVPGWTFIFLDAFDISALQPEGSPEYLEAVRLLNKYNPNDVLKPGGTDYFAGMTGRVKKYVPFNGGLGKAQLDWLETVLLDLRESGDRAIVCTHVPIHPSAPEERLTIFNCDEVLRILHEDGAGRVVAVLAGHAHEGGYFRDPEGLHHVTLESPLTHADGAFAHLDLHTDRMELVGYGAVQSRRLDFPAMHVLRAKQ